MSRPEDPQVTHNLSVSFSLAETRAEFAWCVHIRTLVFVIEQKCLPEIEIDGHEDECRHVLGRADGIPCATARWRFYAPGIAKIERVAVLDHRRGQRIGYDLMRYVLADIERADQHIGTIRLGAQDYAIPFYQRLGFSVAGDGFLEAGIPHHWMERQV